MFREVYSLCIVVDGNEYVPQPCVDAMTCSCYHLVLSLGKRVPMKMHRRLSIPDDTSVFRTVGDVGASRWIGPAFWALVANSRRSEQMTVYIHYARG